MSTFFLVFALIALFVGSFIIYNTFSILVAQRSRETALLRAIGASRRQVLGSILLEALAVGLVASVLGVVAGVGMAQLLSLIPGVSRSGATIMGGISLGLSRVAATEFSFFLAIPIMFAASGYSLFKARDVLTMTDAPVFATGFVISFITAVVVVKQFIRFVSSNTFRPFAWYRIVFGCLLLAYYFTR